MKGKCKKKVKLSLCFNIYAEWSYISMCLNIITKHNFNLNHSHCVYNKQKMQVFFNQNKALLFNKLATCFTHYRANPKNRK
jgi:hypothetical protein